jgi:aryl-alcohol dehydrogenase-like predicted oxidoreductase
MQQRLLGNSGLSIAPLVLGGNVFGWTADEKASFEVLDAFVELGFNAIDTADLYSVWVPCHKGGESETLIGRWLKARPGMRDKVVIFTKVGMDLGGPGQKGLSRRWIHEEADASLRRLGIDRIDLYFSHRPDPGTPLEETLSAYDALIRAGKVGAIGLSGASAEQLQQALDASKAHGLPAYTVLQPEYNLYDRAEYEGALRDLCLRENLGVVPYYGLASGFLSGKYRRPEDASKNPARGKKVAGYFNERGYAILGALDAVGARHGAQPAEVALAWLMATQGVTAPIASATSAAQVRSFARAAALSLSAGDMQALDDAGRP